MELDKFEKIECEKIMSEFIERCRPPVQIRNELDLEYRIKGQSIEIFEIRPMRDNSNKKIEEAVAKATFVKTRKIWKVYWMRANMR